MDPTLLFFAIPIGLGISLPIIGGGLYLFERRLSKKKKLLAKHPFLKSSFRSSGPCGSPYPKAKAASDTQLVLTGVDAVTGQLRTARSTDSLVDSDGTPIGVTDGAFVAEDYPLSDESAKVWEAIHDLKGIVKKNPWEKSTEPPVFEEPKIVDKIISDITNNPRSWSIRWSGGNNSKVKSVIKSMPSTQDGRDNEVSISPDGTLHYNRNRPSDNKGGSLKINLSKKDKTHLRQAFDAVIAYKMSGAIDQVVA